MTMQTTVQPAPRHLQRAQRYFDDGQLVAACATLEAHLRRTPDDADSLSLLLHAWLKRGRMRPAVELAQRLAALPAHDAQAALRTATDLMRVGDFTRARCWIPRSCRTPAIAPCCFATRNCARAQANTNRCWR